MTNESDSFVNGEVSYSYNDKELRDRFIVEYLRDYSSYSACVRIGYESEEAVDAAQALMEETYVKRGIADAEAARATHLNNEQKQDLTNLPPGFVPHEEEMDRQRIVSGLFREAFYRGPGATHSSRVSALSKLADVYKLTKQEDKTPTRTTNVMIVPAVGSVKDWEAGAIESQAELKKTVAE